METRTSRQHSIPTSFYNADESITVESPVTNSSSAPSSRPLLEIQDDTNVDAIELSYMQTVLGAEWVDTAGNPAPAPDADEAMRLVKTMIKYQRETSRDDSSFLVNVAAMAGARLLNRKLQIVRAGEDEVGCHYMSVWKLQYGAVQGSIDVKCCVPKPDRRRDSRDILQDDSSDLGGLEELEANGRPVDWRKKYVELHQRTLLQGEKLKELKSTVLNGILQAKEYI